MPRQQLGAHRPINLLDGIRLRDALHIAEGTLVPPLVAKQRFTRLTPNDPLYVDQWHLNNTGQGGGIAGNSEVGASFTAVTSTVMV